MRKPIGLRRALLALVLFGVTFGYVEAAVVVYLREVSQPAIAQIHPGQLPSDLFPILTPAQLTHYPALWRTLKIELGREAATLLMLAAIAIAIGNSRAEAAGAFVAAFGVWDISFYAFLRLFIHWPASLLTWDLLFLLPVPWSGPVLAPVIVAASMIFAGVLVLWREARQRPVCPAAWHWLLIFLGGLIIILSFTLNFRALIAGGVPARFNWPLFAIGEVVGFGAFLAATRCETRAAQ